MDVLFSLRLRELIREKIRFACGTGEMCSGESGRVKDDGWIYSVEGNGVWKTLILAPTGK
jgi:hypothetical protein